VTFFLILFGSWMVGIGAAGAMVVAIILVSRRAVLKFREMLCLQMGEIYVLVRLI
jgi:hypothetical protein